MNPKDWELLIVLSEEGTIRKAAQRLYISQPALTYRIKQLEMDFNIQIIVRGHRGIRFTAEGEYLLEYAKKMRKELQATKEHIQNLRGEITGSLRIGVSSNFSLYQLPNLLEAFLARYPDVELHLTTGWSSTIMSSFQKEEVHLAIIRGEHDWQGEKFMLKSEPLCLAAQKPFLLSELPSLNFINYQTEPELKTIFNEWWKNTFEAPPKIMMNVDKLETCKELVKRGMGYSMFPGISLREEDNLYIMDMSRDGEIMSRTTWLLYRRELLELNTVAAFYDFIKKFYRK